MQREGATREVGPDGSITPKRDCSFESGIAENRLGNAGGCEEDRLDQKVEKVLDGAAHRRFRLLLWKGKEFWRHKPKQKCS